MAIYSVKETLIYSRLVMYAHGIIGVLC